MPATLTDPPVTPNGDGPPIAPEAPATAEAVSGGIPIWLGTYLNHLHSLPHFMDDLTRDFGDGIYDEMRKDPQVKSDLNTLKVAILSGGLSAVGCNAARDEDEEALASEIKDFCEFTVSNLRQPFITRTLWNMLDAMSYGVKVAEKVYREATAEDYQRFPLLAARTNRQALILDYLKVKHRRSVAFVVDKFLNVLGIAAMRPGMNGMVSLATIAVKAEDLLPLSKFAILTHDPTDEDPRGQSIHRTAYHSWWQKMQNWGEWLKFITLFGGPSLWINLPPGAVKTQTIDENGATVTVDPYQANMEAGQNVRMGSVGVGAHGTEVIPLKMAGEGTAYSVLNDTSNREISKAHLLQTLATMEGQHQARASSQTHQDILGQLVAFLKSWVEAFIESIWKHDIRLNYGEEAVRLCPKATLGDVNPEDVIEMFKAVAALEKVNYLTPRQKQYADGELLHIQPRTDEDVVDEEKRRKAAPINPTTGGGFGSDDDDEGDEDDDKI